MNSKILKLLEFNKITDLLKEQAGSELTKARIGELCPMTNLRMVADALTETTEAVSVIIYKGNIPIGEIGDISPIISMAKKGQDPQHERTAHGKKQSDGIEDGQNLPVIRYAGRAEGDT
jgi:dsDNA-specific endonuclease/ATPase MutS2